ncbi:MAG: hypothetical protein ACYC9S_09920 [Leptospirales bacterium]
MKPAALFGINVLFLSALIVSSNEIVSAGPLYGPPPNGAVVPDSVPGGGYTPPQAPDQTVPTYGSPGFNGNGTSGGNPQSSGSPPNQAGQLNPNLPGQPGGYPGYSQSPSNGTSPGQPVSDAPTFMNNAMPNSSNPFLPNNISPGLLSGPLENAYLQNGVPQLAAPLMSVVYRPFGLTYFQPNPFQVTPQGMVSLTGTFETDTNINFSPNQPELGSLYTISPAVYYSTFDDYGYLSFLASASYVQYDTGNISPYLDETGGVSAGSYLGTRVFVGAQDFITNGSSPQMNGTPLAFFNGINPYYYNLSDAEVGLALTPKITFVEAASDMYFDDGGYGAGIMNIQSLMSTLNFQDKTTFLSASEIYQQALFSDFPGFISNGVMGTAMRTITPTTSLGVGGSASYYLYQGSPSFNFLMDSYYGLLTHSLTRSLSVSLEGGWNVVTFYSGQSFQAPLIDLSLSYTSPRLGLGLNVGKYMENINSYGIEMGPEDVDVALGYLNYQLGAKTSLYSSIGYTYYHFLNAYNYANNFFNTLQPNVSYDGAYLDQSDGIFYKPYTWLITSLNYNMIDFSTNVPNETIIDNQFIAMVTFMWQFK